MSVFLSNLIITLGVVSLDPQEHFYMETQTTTAVPGEDDEMTLYVSTQGPYLVQALIADILGLPMNKITVVVKRLGVSLRVSSK